MNVRLQKTRYIPEGSTEIKSSEANAVVYVYDVKDGILCAIAYGGKRSKSDFHLRFTTPEKRLERINRYFNALIEDKQWKAELQAERKNVENTYQVGDILSGSWGYDQTNAEFWQVVRVSAKSVWIREIAMETVKDSGGFMCRNVMPLKDQFVERKHDPNEPKMRRVGKFGVNLNGHCTLSKWNGSPQYDSWYA